MITTTLYPSKAVYVDNESPTSNYNSDSNLRAGIGSAADKIRESLLQFDLSGINGTISSAVLRMYSYSNSCWQTSVDLQVLRNIASFAVASVTYNTKPATTTTGAVSRSVSGYNTWYEWNITSIINTQKSGVNYGITVKQSTTTLSRAKCFYKTDSTYRPQLVVTYTPYGNMTAPTVTINPAITEDAATVAWFGGVAGAGQTISHYTMQYRDSEDGLSWSTWLTYTPDGWSNGRLYSTSGSGSATVHASTTDGAYRQFRLTIVGSAGTSYQAVSSAVTLQKQPAGVAHYNGDTCRFYTSDGNGGYSLLIPKYYENGEWHTFV